MKKWKCGKIFPDHSKPAIKKQPVVIRLLFTSFIVCCLQTHAGAFVRYKSDLKRQVENISVTGTVKNENGEPLGGASIKFVNGNTGTTTDSNGHFSLSVPGKGGLILISYVGYEDYSVNITASQNLNITLKLQAREADSVVVIGYGTMKRKDLTGAITTIKPDKVAEDNPKTVQDILRGTPGINVSLDGSAKSGGTIRIRGTRSVYSDGGHNDPLLILDGMIFYGELSEINPDDIAQIDVLKDASAAAIYGAKSANGVIIITTKKGKMGKPTINLTVNNGLSTMGVNKKVYGPEGYMQYRQDWYTEESYGTDAATGAYAPYETGVSKGKLGYYERPTDATLSKYGITLDQWRGYSTNVPGASDDEIWASRLMLQATTMDNFLKGKSFDWYKHSFRDGYNQDYNLSVSGASDKMNYYLSAGYLSNQGVVVGDNYKAIRSNLKVDGKITNWLDINANINFQDRSDGNIAVDWNKQITSNSPFASYKNDSGQLEVYPMGETLTANRGYNFDFDKNYMALQRGYTVLNTIFNAKVTLPFHITYSFNISPRYQWYHNRYFTSAEHPDWLATDHGVDRETTENFDWSLNNTLNWDETFDEKHKINVTLVQESEEEQSWDDQIHARNIQPTDALGFHETANGDPNYSSFSSSDSKQTADALLARAFYSYDDRYMFTGSVRRDGYSAFGTSNPRATFYSVAFAWNFTNEKFFNWKALNSGKLRISYGQNGNRSLANPYVALADLAPGVGTEGYVNPANLDYIQYYYLRIDRMANPDLQWEKTTAYNAGLDLSFLNNRITSTLDYYIMPTHNMIMSQSLPDFTGFSSITTNLGEVQNKGFEISFNTVNIQQKNFSWNTTFGFTESSNKIKHLYYTFVDQLDANGNIISSKETDDVANKWFIGHPIGAIWDYKVTGIWQVNEADEAAKYGQRPGDPKVANIYTADDKQNTDGTASPVYNNNDKVFQGQTTAPVMWSLRNDFTFHNFNFSFNIYSYMGAKTDGTAYLNQDNNGSSIITYNGNVYEKKYWTLDNPSNYYARLDSKGPSGVTSPGQILDKSFIRLDNVTVGYTMPKKILDLWKFQNLKLYFTVRNVAVWKKDKHWNNWDIETESITPRIYNFGINVTF